MKYHMLRGIMYKQFVIYLVLIVHNCVAPPVTNTKKENVEEEEANVNGLEDYMEYHRYLKEVVNALESDPEFRKKLEKADESEIKSGKIAEELQFVSHHVRNRLDEIKRVELQRLKELTEKKRKLEDSNSIDEDPVHHHLDHSNPHTFEIEDLKKLIAKTTADLAEADKQRKEQFKQYELEKEYQKQEKLNHTNGEEHEKLEKELKEMEEKHKKHEKLHEPGHKAQLEEVWQEQDQMQQDFDPKTFFMLHDLDGNGLWDQDEVKSLFIKELDKMYQQGAPEDDMRERYEEMERMRESVFREMDRNHDGFIDFNEFFQQTNSADFKEDHGWQGLDEQKPFTDEELAEYIRQHQAHSEYQNGPHGAYQQVPPGSYQQVHPGAYQQAGSYQHVPPGGYQQPPSGGYQQPPPGAYQQPPPGGYHQPQPGYQQNPSSQYPEHWAQNPQGPQGNYQVPQNNYPQNVPVGQAPVNNPNQVYSTQQPQQQQVNQAQQQHQQINQAQQQHQQINQPQQQQQQINQAQQQHQQINQPQQQQQQINQAQQQHQQINQPQQQQQQVNQHPQQPQLQQVNQPPH